MPDDVDAMLKRLAKAPVPSGLTMPIDLILAQAKKQTAHRSFTNALRFGALAAIIALFMGVVGSGHIGHPAQTQVTISPFGPTNPLLPSTLLADNR